jgi:replicative DNA helicase
MADEKSYPNNENAEKYVLGGILLNNDLMTDCLGELTADDFYQQPHKLLYEGMENLAEAGKSSEINHITLVEALKDLGTLQQFGTSKDVVEVISDLKRGLPKPKKLNYYIRLIKKAKLDREKIIASNLLQSALKDGDEGQAEEAEQRLYDLSIADSNTGTEHTSKFSNELLSKIHKTGLSAKPVIGLATGIYDFDILTTGLQPEDLMILAARPGAGKTALAMNIAHFASVKRGAKVLVFSMEMSRSSLLMRMLSSEARVPLYNLRKGFVTRQEWARLVYAMEKIDSGGIIINEQTSLTPMQMRGIIKKTLAKEKRIDLIIIDYLQLMDSNTNRRAENRQQEVTQISKALKNIAKEFHLPVIALSQLSRAPEQRTSNKHRPQTSDLRESGAIEQDADIVSFIYREEMYEKTPDNDGLAELIITKHRNGETGTISLAFLKQFTRFENLFLTP